MAPIPLLFNEDTKAILATLQRRQTDLVDFQIPRLRSFAGSLSEQQALAAELREDVETFANQVETVHVAVGDHKGEKNRRELAAIVDELRNTLTTLRRDSRAALLTSKRAIDAQSHSKREELFKSNAVSEKADPNEKVTDDALMKASDDVTDALRRTIGLMQGELERSVLSTQMLDSSNATLRSTSSTYDTLNNLMGTSKQLITALEKSDWLDRLLMIVGFVFFILVVLFVVKVRILDKSIRVAFWWTRFIPDFGGDDALLNNLEEGMRAVTPSLVDGISSAVTTAALVSSTLSAQISSTTTMATSAQDTETSGSSSVLNEFIQSRGTELAQPLSPTTATPTKADDPRRTYTMHDVQPPHDEL